jgi:membrane associated rhomboid family serine protease
VLFIPFRQKNPPESTPWATIGLIAVNTIVYLCVDVVGNPTGEGAISEAVAKTYGVSLNNLSPLTLLTSMFLHGDYLHLIGNMLFLYLFGFAVEGRVKWWKFLLVYFIAGVAGDGLHFAILGAANPDVPSIGASGAIMGVMGAALWMFPHAKINIFIWWGWIIRVAEWSLYWVALYYIGIDVLWAVLLGGRDGTAHLAHIGGAVAGFVIVAALRIKRDDEHMSEAKAHVAETKDYSFLSTLELEGLIQHQPDNEHLALMLVARSVDGRKPIADRAMESFVRLFPKMMQTQDAKFLATTVAAIATDPRLPVRLKLAVAMHAEKNAQPQIAMSLFEMIRADSRANADELESATFRLAQVSEQWFQNWMRAESLYKECLQRWPMSPMENQIRRQLEIIGPRAAKQLAESWDGTSRNSGDLL